jgi:hypothetical protein
MIPGIIAGVVLLVSFFLPALPVQADAPSVKITAPANGSVVILDYNEFNIIITVHIPDQSYDGTVNVFYYDENNEKVDLDEVGFSAYCPSRTYPHDSTYERRAWMPVPPGTYTIWVEYWSHKLKPGQASVYIPDKLLDTDKIAITIPPKIDDITDPPVFTTQPEHSGCYRAAGYRARGDLCQFRPRQRRDMDQRPLPGRNKFQHR